MSRPQAFSEAVGHTASCQKGERLMLGSRTRLTPSADTRHTFYPPASPVEPPTYQSCQSAKRSIAQAPFVAARGLRAIPIIPTLQGGLSGMFR